jgi:fumarate hydratase subunit beta
MNPSVKSGVIPIETPIPEEAVADLRVGDRIEITGRILCGRDAVLPKIVRLIEMDKLSRLGLNLKGAVIFHTAVSPAGIGPTTSSKVEIEGSIPALSRVGVKIHLGKGCISDGTVRELQKCGSLFAVTPPVSALFNDRIRSKRVCAFEEEGMEALFELEVVSIPAIIAVAHGRSIFADRH